MYSSSNSGMLGLEMSLQHRLPPPHQHSTVGYGGDYHSETQQSGKQGYPHAAKAKNPSLTFSDDDEHGFTAENNADDGKPKMSPWQRMKWTDNMVRLLIMVVYYIGDEVGSEGNDKKKGGTVLQKKGKWKSVSRAMMEKGFYVSPQQCEDKFNDLNKRYKRVNDIVGKGTACRVVENQSLLDTMDNLSMKMKEEVKKLLNSKHLFFKEMCAYHNSCGHGTHGGGGDGGSGGAQDSLAEPSQSQQQRCLHSSAKIKGSKVGKGVGIEEEYDEEDSDEDDDDDDDEEDENDDDPDEQSSRKRLKKGLFHSPMIQQFSTELTNMLQDGTRSPSEKRQWMERRSMQLEEEHFGFQSQAFEIEKQRLKWLKFSAKKEREMEREKLSNERLKLENERMVFLIRQKELELLDLQSSSNKRSDPSITG
ncbi:unnamed protein product [Fraxinus pennsylvanica]|uniref:Myb/SANT-like DNA-binding domain-containing protein n=1 Tax=Fraxinus pennsylvanica TaxID=56036 RepID=A0AAD2DQ57_9LAMI|nr:unnamed protein product [Fraxinus pennsylvanica]